MILPKSVDKAITLIDSDQLREHFKNAYIKKAHILENRNEVLPRLTGAGTLLNMLDLEKDLNEAQLEAVSRIDGPLLVIAGAGSGKTRVITYRIANMVENHGIEPWRILAVTFTNKAAKEMKERVVRLLGGRGLDCWVSTFHSTSARLLRFHGEQVGIDPKFTIYDESDQKAMVARCLKELNLAEKQFPPRLIQNEINRAKRELITAQTYETGGYYREQVQNIFDLYEKRMRASSALDFGDLILRLVLGMQGSTELFDAVTGRFDYVLVDEFQDTNRVQLELIKLMAKPHGNICVVGDDDQSIYSWRGADVSNILEFDKYFPGTQIVTMDRNYRSTANILKAAQGVVNKLNSRREKKLWTESAAGEQLAYIEAEDERDEARLIARAIRELKDDGYPLGEQAVFYRINAQSRVFEEVFRALDIPHRVVGGMRFYERAEIKDVLAYLRLILNPSDLAAFLRIINTPARGIGKATVDKLIAMAAGLGVSPFEAIVQAAEMVGAGMYKRLVAFRNLITDWRAEIDLGPLHLASRVLEDTGYIEGLKAEDSAEADARMENLKELIGSIKDFEAEAETPSLESYLELIVLQTDVDVASFDGDEVTLMTIHSAKGLEFEVVHLTGLEEDLFPYRQSRDDFERVREAEMDEERRLCYVAMTRARSRLFLTRARSRTLFGRGRMNYPSRFLNDLPQNLVVDLTLDRPSVRPLAPAPSPPVPSKTWIDRSFDQSPDDPAPHAGQKARHATYGIGKVVSVRPGARPKVEVLFPVYGKKVILADYLEFD
jgi:DNA helicase-2/ATP-dependent DNA helicase PcrA